MPPPSPLFPQNPAGKACSAPSASHARSSKGQCPSCTRSPGAAARNQRDTYQLLFHPKQVLKASRGRHSSSYTWGVSAVRGAQRPTVSPVSLGAAPQPPLPRQHPCHHHHPTNTPAHHTTLETTGVDNTHLLLTYPRRVQDSKSCSRTADTPHTTTTPPLNPSLSSQQPRRPLALYVHTHVWGWPAARRGATSKLPACKQTMFACPHRCAGCCCWWQ